MTFLRDPDDHGLARRFWRIYREKRRDQAPHHPELTMRMDRRHAAAIAWRQARNGGGSRGLRE